MAIFRGCVELKGILLGDGDVSVRYGPSRLAVVSTKRGAVISSIVEVRQAKGVEVFLKAGKTGSVVLLTRGNF